MALAVPNIDQLRKRWTTDEYLAAVEPGGVFQRREWLFRGEVLEMPPMGRSHALALVRVQNWANEIICVLASWFACRLQS